jgi:hypothetical protein
VGGKSNEDEWRTKVFDGCIFSIFHQLRVGAKNTIFPFSILCTYSQPKAKSIIGKFLLFSTHNSLDNRAQLTRNFILSQLLASFHPIPATHSSIKQRKNGKVCAKARDSFYFYPCVQLAREQRAQNPYDIK